MTPDDAAAAYRPARLFTYAEANALLPALIPWLEQLRADRAALIVAQRELRLLTPAMRGNGHAADAQRLDAEIQERLGRVRANLSAISELGVEVKQIETGLIDFPTVRDGRIVYLCWRLGEGPIAYWHELDAGFAGRQPLSPGEQ